MSHLIKLGAVGALRDYTLKPQGDGISWQRGPASPFSAKVNTSGKYDEVDIWNEWVQEDWQQGVGRIDPQIGGFLYAEVETRVPNQIILAQAPVICSMLTPAADYSNYSYSPGQAANLTTLTLGATYLAINVDATNSITVSTTGIWIYAEAVTGTIIRADLYSDTAGSPNTSIANASTTITADFPGPHWYRMAVAGSLATSTDDFWIVIRVTTGSAIIHGSDTTPSMSVKTSPDGSAWATTTFRPFFNVTLAATSGSAAGAVPTGIIKVVYSTDANDVVYIGPSTIAATPSSGIWFLNSSNYLVHTGAVTFARVPVDVCVFANVIIVAFGTAGAMIYYALDGTGGNAVAGNPTADVLLSFGGYFYSALAENLYWANTVAQTNGPYQVCSTPFKVRSMAGMEGSVYMACDDGLYRFAPGNVVEGIAPWPTSPNNGRSMVTHGGGLYMTVNGRVLRYSVDGRLEDVWVSRDDDLPANRLGEVVALATSTTNLLALVKESSATGRSSVWAYQDEGWHHMCTLPTNNGSTLYWDRVNSRLHIGTSNGQACYVDQPDFAINPYNDTASIYMPAGWMEQDRYYGDMYLLNKDFESVSIVGHLASGQTVKVYWQDEDSTSWELLGTADADAEELRWSNHATRPQRRWIRLGILLTTNDEQETPAVHAVITKCSPMINDRFRDTVTIMVKSYIQGPDGTLNVYTLAQQMAHIESMISSVIPVIYEDPLGIQYEVRVVDHSVNMPTFAYENNANVVKELEYTLVLEQVANFAYA